MITVKGQARHHFWGTYCSTIGLFCKDAAEARDVVKAMGEGWKLHESDSSVVIFHGSDPELGEAHKTLESFGADLKKVSSIKHSIDRGEVFEIRVNTTPEEQLALFG